MLGTELRRVGVREDFFKNKPKKKQNQNKKKNQKKKTKKKRENYTKNPSNHLKKIMQLKKGRRERKMQKI